MATVIVQAVASLDGFIARPDDLPGPIFDWYEAGDVELRFNPDHVVPRLAGSRRTTSTTADTRCQVIGRHLFDVVDGWGGLPIVGDRVFVVTHRDDADEWRAALPGRAVHVLHRRRRGRHAQATEHAGDGTVVVCAGEVAGQVVRGGAGRRARDRPGPGVPRAGEEVPGFQHRRDRPRRPARGGPGRSASCTCATAASVTPAVARRHLRRHVRPVDLRP